jgi:hypothetical protein
MWANATVYGQGYPFKWAKPIKMGLEDMMTVKEIITTDDGAAYANTRWSGIENYYLIPPHADYLYKYNLQGKTIQKVPYKLKTPAGNADMEFVVNLGEKMYFFMSAQNKSTKKHVLYMQTVNKGTAMLNGTPKNVLELNYSGEPNYRPVYYRYSVSPDNSKLAIHCALLKKKEIIRSLFVVYDSQLNLLWKSNDIVSEGISNPLLVQDFAVNNDGNVFFCGRTLAQDKKRSTIKNFNPQNYVVMMSKDNPNANPVEIEFPENTFGLESSIAISPQNEAYCVGAFSKELMANGLGFYVAKINTQDGKIDKLTLDEFGTQLITEGYSQSDAKKIASKIAKNESFENYKFYFDKVQFLKDGSLVLCAAKRYSAIFKTRDGELVIYYNGDIFVGKYSQNLETQFVKKISRSTEIMRYPIWGFHSLLLDENEDIHVFYNLVPSTAFLGVNFLNKATTIHVTFDKKGESEWETLHDSKTDKITARPWEMTYINGTDEILLPGSKGAMTLTFTTFKLK